MNLENSLLGSNQIEENRRMTEVLRARCLQLELGKVTRLRITDSEQSKEELRDVYYGSVFNEVRREAGKVLGYSSLRIETNIAMHNLALLLNYII